MGRLWSCSGHSAPLTATLPQWPEASQGSPGQDGSGGHCGHELGTRAALG